MAKGDETKLKFYYQKQSFVIPIKVSFLKMSLIIEIKFFKYKIVKYAVKF